VRPDLSDGCVQHERQGKQRNQVEDQAAGRLGEALNDLHHRYHVNLSC
jgi:hypothetical protein